MTISDDKNVKITMVAAGGVVYKIGDNGEVLVLLIQHSHEDHWPDMWEFPRGKCDKPIGESPRHCVVREVKEETGLDVEVVRFIDKFIYLADKGTRKTICYNYLCRMKDPNQQVKLRVNLESGIREHQAYKWIMSAALSNLALMPEQARTLRKVFSFDLTTEPEESKTDVIEEYLNRLQKK